MKMRASRPAPSPDLGFTSPSEFTVHSRYGFLVTSKPSSAMTDVGFRENGDEGVNRETSVPTTSENRITPEPTFPTNLVISADMD
mmetsp:Transcript_9009/g.15768  ORF Transcript_9009/g.15768 Transcript_9009/m.15768 type:complete len:85 (-) Transcript_9009:306-560(-)